MKTLLLILFFLGAFLVNGQPSCSTTGLGGDIFYPNTVSTPTSASNGNQYLCGPNTVVYDTIPIGCLFVHVNTGSTLFYNKGCPQLNVNCVWLKDNSTLNVLPNCPPMSLTVYYEPLAVINNPAAVQIASVACASITFPMVCATGINAQNQQDKFFKIWPNPTSTKVNILLRGVANQPVDITITNELGETVYENKQFNTKEIPVDNFKDGVYFIQIKTKERQQREKFILVR